MQIKDVEHYLWLMKGIAKKYGIKGGLLKSIEDRALRSYRVFTQGVPQQRQYRWILDRKNRQYATERNCQLVLLKLLATIFEFKNAPVVLPVDLPILEKILSRKIRPDSCLDVLTGEKLDFLKFIEQSSVFHISHLLPRAKGGSHHPDNVEWSTRRGNLLQSDLPLDEAKQLICSVAAFIGG